LVLCTFADWKRRLVIRPADPQEDSADSSLWIDLGLGSVAGGTERVGSLRKRPVSKILWLARLFRVAGEKGAVLTTPGRCAARIAARTR
jgi:hypothetical protein